LEGKREVENYDASLTSSGEKMQTQRPGRMLIRLALKAGVSQEQSKTGKATAQCRKMQE
jgi:hypothetical protein